MAVDTFKEFLKSNNLTDINVIVSDDVTHTAQQAADVHGVPVSNIVKSLLVKIDDGYALVLVPGHLRLELEEWKTTLNSEQIRMAKAEEVKQITGYSIGGVPPFGHVNKIKTYIADGFDKTIDLVAAAGSANSVFKISYEKLTRITAS